MKRLLVLSWLFLAIECMAVKPVLSRYVFSDGRGEFLIDTVCSRLKIEICVSSSDRSHFAKDKPMAWIMAWNVDGANYDFMRVSESRYTLGECYSAVIGRRVGGVDILSDSIVVNDPLSRHPGAVWTTLDFYKDRLYIACGSSKLRHILSSDNQLPVSSRCRVMGDNIDFESVVVESYPDISVILDSGMTEAEIMSRLAESHDAIEGIWQYFDRDTDGQCSRLGGRYKIAIISDNRGGYYMIYLDGAVVNPSLWRSGMIKGRLRPTPFADQYSLLWYDSTGDPLETEVDSYLSVDNSSLITVAFPLYGSSFRLSRSR